MSYYNQIKQILVERLPKLKPKLIEPECFLSSEGNIYFCPNCNRHQSWNECGCTEDVDFTHFDIVEALGEDWAIDGKGFLLEYDGAGSFEAVVSETENGDRNIQLPLNLHDLDLPEHEETAKKLLLLLNQK